MRKVTIIGVPMWLGQTHFGTHLGPDAIRSAGLIEQLQLSHSEVVDAGNLPINIEIDVVCSSNSCIVRNLEGVCAGVSRLAEKVAQTVKDRRFPLILGGDHSSSIGSLNGLSRHYRNLGVIWYDAHADSNTPETSPSGNAQGMPLAASLGLGHPDLIEIGGYRHKVKAENVVLIGIRDIDPGEKQLIQEKQIKTFTAEDVHRLGISAVMEETIAYLGRQCDGIHLSFDMDVIDPSEACGVGTPVAGGISMDSNLQAMNILAQSKVITSADFVELNPLLDKDNQTAKAAVALIQALLTD
ncbi:MAG: arginase [Firmicutes bacterium]|nr:arginase [Bacillota bacterium]